MKLSPNDQRALQYIRKRIVVTGISPTVRELRVAMGFGSLTTANNTIARLIDQGWLKRGPTNRGLYLLREPESSSERRDTVRVPLVGAAACGMPLLAEQNIEGRIEVSTTLAKPNFQHFFLRAVGESMNAAKPQPIPNGAFVLVRQQSIAEQGQLIVALINDEATIKEFRSGDGVVMLWPRSTHPDHQKPIIVEDDFQIQGVVVKALPPASLASEDGGEGPF